MAATELIRALDLEVPIFQAPMAGVSSPAMAAAVSNAGGLGALGIGASGVAQAQEMIQQTRALTARPFNVNVFCHQPAVPDPAREAAWLDLLAPVFARFNAAPPAALSEIYTSFVVDRDMQKMLLAERPAVISFHFGLPAPDVILALKEAGIFLMASATSLAEARAIRDAGVQAVVAQGWEAGGHRGIFDPAAPDERLNALDLTRRLVAELDLPVVTAGGLMTGGDIAAALRLGASAAQLGTAFIDCSESLADGAYRARLHSKAADATQMTAAISGRPARCLANDFTAWAAEHAGAAVPDYPIAYDAGKALNAAAKSAGASGFGAQWAGQGAPHACSGPAAEIMAALIAEWRAAMA
ncbi:MULTISPECIES: NAD(P)H-dependent flavin oxidoreductase [Rhodobacterales]|uniref:NAD(P)H-dependent flavin oxidoreductase n=1 Tax=Rhodobacterales TaxID=204455 RepID=UPI00237F691C|nr:nitronate monooxygenase [Phaeobacter gallaeciensis]MDE4141100.1 nitronate monooxygenase [Phaeobacter gallaeciensis]MDE4149545.1 nitronate monooxygenase [Phaeobacter gallaeciensis]MDE4154005.1 nitronate monooxygenase [Phaeobacter gallaeciensis]MDE4229397.1 nitronate monooxygenase [Phaeobacter gallaeciensis]MDE4258235.1 nitronate monooxygenase [Phaeobacter gallaeciensis]